MPTSTKKPLFSVIIPTYNRAEELRRALESIEKQTFKSYEVIVCDDGSTDSTRSVVDSFAERITVVHLWDNNWGGPARPRNRGIRAARGEWLCLLDSDDWWYPNKLEVVMGKMQHADVVCHAADMFSQKGKHFLKFRGRKLRHPAFIDLMTRGNPLITSAMCLRKSVLDRTGLFSESKELISVEDMDLWLRIALITERFLHIPASLGAVSRWEGNISKSLDRFSATHGVLHEKFKGYLTEEDRLEAAIYLEYSMGVKKLEAGMIKECRKHFYLSMKSRNTGTIMRSLVRLLMTVR